MSFLSPEKLLVVFVIIMIVIGPEKLPAVARQMGSALQTIRSFQARMESEVREAVPNLPSSTQIAKMARSPAAFISTLVDHSILDEPKPDPGAVPAAKGNDWPADAAAPVQPPAGTPGTGAAAGDRAPVVEPLLGDPSMN